MENTQNFKKPLKRKRKKSISLVVGMHVCVGVEGILRGRQTTSVLAKTLKNSVTLHASMNSYYDVLREWNYARR